MCREKKVLEMRAKLLLTWKSEKQNLPQGMEDTFREEDKNKKALRGGKMRKSFR